jgi:hypothetical protein
VSEILSPPNACYQAPLKSIEESVYVLASLKRLRYHTSTVYPCLASRYLRSRLICMSRISKFSLQNSGIGFTHLVTETGPLIFLRQTTPYLISTHTIVHTAPSSAPNAVNKRVSVTGFGCFWTLPQGNCRHIRLVHVTQICRHTGTRPVSRCHAGRAGKRVA